MNAVLSFLLAYILTRPLGASTGDLLASARKDGGLGLGTPVTSFVFLGADSRYGHVSHHHEARRG
jgi:uncharacterized membrane-anchored protein